MLRTISASTYCKLVRCNMARLIHQSIIDKLTLAEKVELLSGANFWNTKAIPRVGLPSVMLTDGPHGVRKQGGKADNLGLNNSLPATCFPTAASLANSWDAELIEDVGRALGSEAAAKKVGVLLGPGLNLVRDPLGGRTFEYYSEDPLISGKLAAAMVRGIQSTGVAATLKHFAVNSQERLRMTMDEVVDERTLHELYLEGFRIAVREGKPEVVMSSYNKVNGEYVNESRYLLTDVLRDSWGFDGLVVTDWGGTDNRARSLRAGNDLEMPYSGGVGAESIYEGLNSGYLDESEIDISVNRVISLAIAKFDSLRRASRFDKDASHDMAVRAASESIVLLKNNDVLPLKSGTKISIIGEFADKPRYQGAGSSLVNPARMTTALDSLSRSELEVVGYEKGFKRSGRHSSYLLKRAVNLAEQSDIAVIFAGLGEVSEAEGLDREHMRLPDAQLRLIDKLAKIKHVKIVVVLACGSPVELPFAAKVDAIIHGFLGGQGGGQAVSDVLCGVTNPSGKLAQTYPLTYADSPTRFYFPGKEVSAEHREALNVGYRYYDSYDVAIRYEFGFGISYTTFEYSDISVKRQSVSLMVKNTGQVSGAEIVQVYAVPPKNSRLEQPKHSLIGFAKIHLKPGQEKKLDIKYSDHSFMHYDVTLNKWVAEKGVWTVQIGASSRDIRLSGEINVLGERIIHSTHIHRAHRRIGDDVFVKILGREIPDSKWNRSAKLSYSSTIRQFQYSRLLGRMIYGILVLVRRLLVVIGRPIAGNNIMFILDLPLNRLAALSGGKITRRQIERALKWINRV